MSNQPSIISDRPYSVAQDDPKRGTFALYCGGVYVCGCRPEKEAQAMADSANDKTEALAKRKRLEAAAPKLLAALIKARRSIDVSLINNSKRATAHWEEVATVCDEAIAEAGAAR